MRKTQDKEFLIKLCLDMFGVAIKEDDIVKQFRLGVFSESVTALFKDISSKEIIMHNLKNLNSADGIFKQISIAHDLTPRQRKIAKELVAKANLDYEASDETDKENYKFIVVGANRNPRVVKIKKDPQDHTIIDVKRRHGESSLLSLYLNACTIINKISEFHAIVHSVQPDVIGVTES